MAYKVTLGNPSRTTQRKPDSDIDGELKFDRIIYQSLGSLVQNKKLLELYDENKIPLSYRRTLDELNDLYLKTNYPELATNIIVKEGIVSLDSYLGSLGIDVDYPYSKDIKNIPVWLDITFQSEYRILVDESDNTYLTDGGGTEVLVVYT